MPVVLPKSVVIRFLNYENSLQASWNTSATHTLFESPRVLPKYLARREMVKSAPDTSWQSDSNKSFFSPCSYLMSNHHGFPQTGARRRAMFLRVMSFHLACLTSLLTGHVFQGQMALSTFYRWMAGVQVCWGVGRRWGKLVIPSLECTRKNSSSWGLSLPVSLSDWCSELLLNAYCEKGPGKMNTHILMTSF